MLKLYAGWGLDYIKVDCISDHPYRPTEIRQIAEAIQKTGRAIVLSLSPGPTAVEHAAEVAKFAQMWRISDDHWDVWHSAHKPGDGEFPFGVRDAFDRLAEWAPYVKPGNWPDEDMLPWGSLTPHPGWGDPRQSRETKDEQQTEFTLWAMARSPLILGANLTKLDDFTRSLISNREVLAINQKARRSGPVAHLPAGLENVRAWQAETDGAMGSASPYAKYFSFSNLDDKPVTIRVSWEALGLKGSHAARNLFDGTETRKSDSIELTLPAHGSTIYRIDRQ
jgi:hypothetical protein